MLIGPAGALRRHARTHPPSRRRARRGRRRARPRGRPAQTRADARSRAHARPSRPTDRRAGRARHQAVPRTRARRRQPNPCAHCATRESAAANGGSSTRCYAAICSNSQAKPADVKDRGTSHWTPAGYVSPDGEGPVLVGCRRGLVLDWETRVDKCDGLELRAFRSQVGSSWSRLLRSARGHDQRTGQRRAMSSARNALRLGQSDRTVASQASRPSRPPPGS
jgi:hypothetical protein